MTPVPSNTVHTESPDVAAGPDDLELVARSQAGDTSAFNELVTRYRNRAYAMIYNMVRNEQDAWDLAQDGFLKAWNSYNPKPYLKGLVCFRVEERGAEHDRDPSMGWDACAMGGVQVHVVPGSHVDMMQMPSVSVIADKLAAYLDSGSYHKKKPAAGAFKTV